MGEAGYGLKETMHMEKEEYRIMVQPYLMRECEEYHQMMEKQYGISHFYELTTGENPCETIKAVPDGCVDLLFSLDPDHIHTYIGGTVFQAKKWPFMKHTKYFGVRFEPGKCRLPDGISIEEVIDDDIELEKNAFGNYLSEQIALKDSMEQRIKVFMEQYLCQQEDQDKSCLLEDYIRKRIESQKGNLSIRSLEEETGYSSWYIRRTFKRIHGISPKVFGEFVRFQNLMQQMEKPGQIMSMEEIAVECGYYDQPHMAKNFKKFAGMTPEAYLYKWN